jgi:hypothetical protein
LTVFADSSAVVKLYVDEEGAAEIRAVPHIAVSALTRVEVAAAIWRKRRASELSGQAAALLNARFDSDIAAESPPAARFDTLPVTEAILRSAAEVTAMRALRAYDAVQLASAIAARAADPSCATFACFDRDLREAAAAEGFRLVPAQLSAAGQISR